MNESDTDIDASTDVRVESPEEEDTRVLSDERTEVAESATSSNGTAPERTDEIPEEEKKKKKKGWLIPLGVGLVVVLLIAAVASLLLMNPAGKKGAGRGASRGVGPQAQWQFTAFPIGGKKTDVPTDQTRAIEGLIRRWSEAVYLYPADLRRSTQRYFTTGAANAFRSSDLGLPQDASEVQTKKRTARIWIDVDGARRAAARVEVIATGQSSSGEFRSASQSHLWLEREGNAWKVIGYEVDQRPLPLNPNKGKDESDPPKNETPGGAKGEDKKAGEGAGGKS